MQEKDNILQIFREVKKAIKNNDTFKINQLSNQTNHTASITQDPDNIAVAVVVYSIGKILDRGEYRSYPGWDKFYRNLSVYIDKEIDALKNNNEEEITNTLTLMRGEIDNLSGRLKGFIQDVFRKSEINKASKIYEHGISLEKTAKLLGITMFELAGYAGQKDNIEIFGKIMGEKQRIKMVEDMFK